MSDRVKLHSNSDDVKPPRRYVSSLRDEQARVTRLRILDAARKLFIERGFAGTSIEVIAREAGVAVQTRMVARSEILPASPPARPRQACFPMHSRRN